MDKELVGQIKLCLRVFGNHQKPAGVLVYAVHKHSHALVLNVRTKVQIVCKGVYKGAVVIPVPRVNYHSGRLVHHQDIVVFVGDVKRDILRDNLRAAAFVGHHKLHDVAWPDNVICLHGLVIDQHIAKFDGLLNPVA